LRWSFDDLDVRAAEHGVEGVHEFGVAVADQEPEGLHPGAEVHGEVAALLGDPSAGGACGHGGDVQPAGVVFDEDQHVDPAEQDRVHGEEVARDDGVRLGGQELLPRRAGASRRRVDAGGSQDLPHGRRRDPVPETGQFALDAAMPPQRVVGGHS
jgi:hypothetical protein